MQIFPAFEVLGKSSGNQMFGLDAAFSGRSDADFMDIFSTFMRNSHEDAPFHAPQQETARQETSRQDAARQDTVSGRAARHQDRPEPAPLHGDPPASVHQRELPANREDFARLREKLEQLGVDSDVLDRAEELFDNADIVTWGQVYEVLREPLKEIANIKLTNEQQQDIISLFNKMGFTPQDAKALLSDILDKKYDAVWQKVQDMLTSLTNGQSISASFKEIASLLKALGLDTSDLVKAGLKNLGPHAQDMLQNALNDQKLSPELQAALKTLLAAAKGNDNAVGDAKPDATTLTAIQKVVDAVLKGEIKLDQETLAALRKAVEAAAPGVRLEQALSRLAGEELSPEDLQKLLAMIKDAAAANTQANQANKGEILSEIHQAMAMAESKEQRMAQAGRMDAGSGMAGQSQGNALNTLKGLDNQGANPETKDHSSGREPRNNANNANRNAQGWESFWEKVNVKNSAQNSTVTIQNTNSDARPVVGQNAAATAAEIAARKVVNNAPAPHRTVLQQVHSGLLQNMGQGRQQLTLQLHPAELGSLTVNLKVFGKEVHAVLRAENHEARQIIADNLPQLRQSLEAQGLRVSKLEVHTQLQDNNQFTQLWQGTDSQKFQEQGAKTQWEAMGRGQHKKGASGAAEGDSDEHAAILQAMGREGGIDLIA